MQPAGYPPTSVIDTQKLKPSGIWFWVGGGLIILAIVGSIMILGNTVLDLSDKVDDFERVSMPGSGTVEITGTGGFTLYHEFSGASGEFGRSSALQVTMAGPDGQPVDLELYTGNVNYDYGGHEGVALFSFQVDEPGQYTVVGEGDSGQVAIGRGIGRGLVGGILFGLFVGFAGFVAGVIIIIVVGVRRGRDRRSRQVIGGQWGRGTPPPGAGWGAAAYPGAQPGYAGAPAYPGATSYPGAPTYPGAQPHPPSYPGAPGPAGPPRSYPGAQPPSYPGAPAAPSDAPSPGYPGDEPAGPTYPMPPAPPPPPPA